MRTSFSAAAACVLLTLAAGTVARAGDTANPSAGSIELFQRLDSDGNGVISAVEITPRHKQLFARLLKRADSNRDSALSREEFTAGLTPSRPEKSLEAKQPTSNPQAQAVRYVLLKMDTTRDSSIDADEVPDKLYPIFELMAERIDANNDGMLDRYELSRSAREVTQVSARYVARAGVDLSRELAKLEKSQGAAANRFDEAPSPVIERLANPRQAQAIYKQLDANRDGKLELSEIPEPLQPQLRRLVQMADRDRNGGLSEREFQVAAERIGRMARMRQPNANAATGTKPSRNARQKASIPPETDISGEAMSAEAMSAEK